MSALLIPLLGGALIGLSAAMLLLFNGRIAGISGIVGGFFSEARSELSWRIYFLFGLFFGGLLWSDSVLSPVNAPSAPLLLAAGLMVGVGARLGNGCTSGHGVCGLGHLRLRSFVATVTFICVGALVVLLTRLVGGRS
jgi:uncharacterized membrane protein YedE/YeeE